MKLGEQDWKELKQLHDQGWALHWLKPETKRPYGNDWQKGPRKTWEELIQSYKPSDNVGVRLGVSSKLADGTYLSCVDCDVKSQDPKHLKEMGRVLKDLMPKDWETLFPQVLSGRGNGSRHIYVRSKTPLKPKRISQSTEKIEVHMPSVKPTLSETQTLSAKNLSAGTRLRASWEISIMSQGQQVVLPPSVHPDSKKKYRWKTKAPISLSSVSLFQYGLKDAAIPADSPLPTNASASFRLEKVDLLFGPKEVPDHLANMIMGGEGVSDRSASLLKAANALAALGFTENEVLSVLSDRAYFLGQCAWDRRRNWAGVIEWLRRYTTQAVYQRFDGEKREMNAGLEALKEESFAKPPLGERDRENQKKELLEKADWRTQLERGGQRGDGAPKDTLKNALLVLRNEVDPCVFKRDLFCFRDTYGTDAPWGGKKDALITDSDVNLMIEWFAEKFRFEPRSQTLCAAIDVLAVRNSFHPIRDYFKSLPEWDGEERIERWLKDYAGAADPVYYVGDVFRKWLVAAVTRVFEPGYKFDWMLILEGLQGIGKSLFCETLAGENYFIDRLEGLQTKDAAQNLQGIWIVEMGELSDLKRNELETTKAFITRRIDKYRPPYGRRSIEAARQCVFAGSTNKEKYLKDDQNRRFVPVRVGEIDMKQLRHDRDQLWAEALTIYRNGLEEHLYLEGPAREYVIKLQDERKIEDDSHAMQEVLESFFKGNKSREKEEQFEVKKFKIFWLFEGEGGRRGPLAVFRWTNRNSQFAAMALRRLGFIRYEAKGLAWWKAPHPTLFEF